MYLIRTIFSKKKVKLLSSNHHKMAKNDFFLPNKLFPICIMHFYWWKLIYRSLRPLKVLGSEKTCPTPLPSYRPVLESSSLLMLKGLWNINKKNYISSKIPFREAKSKRALRVHFLTHFTKNFCRFLTPKVKSGTDKIDPSIESSDFLFWYEKI